MIKVKSDDEYIDLLKKANKDLGDLVRERDVQITTLKSALREAKAAFDFHDWSAFSDEVEDRIIKAIATINECLGEE